MKVTFTEEVESRTAFSRKMYCTCGSHMYSIHHQIEPNIWWVACDLCEKEGPMSPAREIAIERWKQIGTDN